MRKILKKSTIVLVMLTFILAMVNINGVNTSFADTKDSTQTTTENNQSDSSSSDETSSTDEDSTEDDENVLKTDDGFKYTVEDDEVTIKGYEGSKTTLTIPSEIDGKKVTKIGANAFDSNTSITSVDFGKWKFVINASIPLNSKPGYINISVHPEHALNSP